MAGLVCGKLAVSSPDSTAVGIKGLRRRACFVKTNFNF